MQHASLTIQQEKEKLKQIKQLRDEKKRLDEWEVKMEELRTKRSQLVEQTRLVSERQELARSVQWLEEAAQTLQLPRESVVEGRVNVSDEMTEMLNTQLWTKRLRVDYQVTSRVARGATKSVLLAGAQDAVDAATAFLQSYGTVVSSAIPVGEEELGLLIGKKGATIAQLQESTGCSLVVQHVHMPPLSQHLAAPDAERTAPMGAMARGPIPALRRAGPAMRPEVFSQGWLRLCRRVPTCCSSWLAGCRQEEFSRLCARPR